MTNYIYSSLSGSTTYLIRRKGGADLPVVIKKITVKGGANLADPKTLLTPSGIVTTVSDEDLELLKKDYLFQKHLKGGYLIVDKKKTDPDKVASDLNQRDPSAPLTQADYDKSDAPVKYKK